MASTEAPTPAVEVDDGFAFRFDMPKEDLSLRSVSLKDGVPIFDFTASKKVPCITEEDVANIVKVVQDGKRPGFFYMGILPGHPLGSSGRHYKHYEPAYLRRTSVGELLAEADWLMKCLHVGVRSDKDRKVFRSWAETSEIDGLPSYDDFPEDDKENRRVIMKCKSVEVFEEDDQLYFSKDPEMMIEDESSHGYSQFITQNYDSVAYYDEPLFLKMKEIIKLILAVEWLKKKEVRFSKEWIEEHKPVNRKPPKPLQVKLSKDETKFVMKKMKEEVDKALDSCSNALDSKQPFTVSKYKDRFSTKEPQVTTSERGIEVKLERTIASPFFEETTGLYVPLVQKVVTRVSASNDLDFVYSDEDPNQPITDSPFSDEMFSRPNVSSWSELLSETEVIPCKWLQDPTNPLRRTPQLVGGVSTSSIPTRTVAKPASVPVKKKVPVKANKTRTKEKIRNRDIPSQPVVNAPSSTAYIDSDIARQNAIARENSTQMHGYRTGSTACGQSSDGHTIQQSELNGMTRITQLIAGKECGPSLRFDMHLPLPPKAGSSAGDSGVSSIASTPCSSVSQLSYVQDASGVAKDDASSMCSDSGVSEMTICDSQSDSQSDVPINSDSD